MNAREALQHFQFADPKTPERLHLTADVFRVRDRRGEWVLKRAGQAHSTAGAIDGWLRAISTKGVRVVVAAEGFGVNPFVAPDGTTWVVHPFIAGGPYTCAPDQIRAAGALLGHMHVADAFNDHGLHHAPRTVWRPWDWVHRHAAVAVEAMRSAGVKTLEFERRVEAWWQMGPAPNGLPMAAGSADFRAVNLIFAPAPVLIDPDRAAFMPRLYDLAIAALLFHHEAAAAGRLWTRGEWLAFLSGYRLTVPAEPDECAAWPDVLRAVWLEQAVWLLGNAVGGWADLRERGYLLALAAMEPGQFPLNTGPLVT